jgi:hypothetical protein
VKFSLKIFSYHSGTSFLSRNGRLKCRTRFGPFEKRKNGRVRLNPSL